VSNGSELKSAGAMALRAAGYKPLPRWWVTAEQLELIEYMALQNADEVNRIRGEANGLPKLTEEQRKQREVERAWQMMKAGKANT
jgi:hypothetical protein